MKNYLNHKTSQKDLDGAISLRRDIKSQVAELDAIIFSNFNIEDISANILDRNISSYRNFLSKFQEQHVIYDLSKVTLGIKNTDPCRISHLNSKYDYYKDFLFLHDSPNNIYSNNHFWGVSEEQKLLKEYSSLLKKTHCSYYHLQIKKILIRIKENLYKFLYRFTGKLNRKIRYIHKQAQRIIYYCHANFIRNLIRTHLKSLNSNPGDDDRINDRKLNNRNLFNHLIFTPIYYERQKGYFKKT